MKYKRSNSLDPITICDWRWNIFLESTIKELSKLNPSCYPINNDFLSKESSFGSRANRQKVIVETWGLKTDKIRQARCACLKAGKLTSVMNLVISPYNNYELPFFGADFVSLPNGHLIALDLQPALKNDIIHTQNVWKKLKSIHSIWQSKLPSGGSIPEEASHFFSPGFLWSRIPLGDEGDNLIKNVIKPAFNDYLTFFLDLVENSKKVSKARSLIILEGQKQYMRYRAKKDPAKGMLKGFFGSTWTENYINNILFDL